MAAAAQLQEIPSIQTLAPLRSRYWVSAPGLSPAAHHHVLVILPAALDPRWPALQRAWQNRLRYAAAGWPVRWTIEDLPTLIRPDTHAGRSLEVRTMQPGLLLIERGLDGDGRIAVEHRATVSSESGHDVAVDLADYSILSAVRLGKPRSLSTSGGSA